MLHAHTLTQNNTVRSIVTQSAALNIKLPAIITSKLDRANVLNNLVSPITGEEIANATVEDMPALVERIARNATFQTPSATTSISNLNNSLSRDLYVTMEGVAEQLYDDVAKKLDKLFDKLNTTAANVPHDFAVNPSLWERQDRSAIEAFKQLRVLIGEAAPLANLLHTISTQFFPALSVSKWEVAAVGKLHHFYDLSGQTSPTLARFDIPQGVALISPEMITYLKGHDVFLHAVPIAERRTTEARLIEQADEYAQLDDNTWALASEAPQGRGGVLMSPAYPAIETGAFGAR